MVLLMREQVVINLDVENSDDRYKTEAKFFSN